MQNTETITNISKKGINYAQFSNEQQPTDNFETSFR